jgi:nicotinate-nucleotide pyrophosphorylase
MQEVYYKNKNRRWLKLEKVKVFTRATHNLFDKLEKDVNKWLSKNKNITIISRQAGVACGVNELEEGFVNCTIVIFYKDKEG